jgi:hypothetical protein
MLILANSLLVLLLIVSPAGAAQPAATQALVRVALPAAGPDAVRPLAQAPLQVLTVETLPLPYVLARAEARGLDWLKANGYAVDVLDGDAAGATYLMVDLAGALAGRERPGVELYNDGVRAVRRLDAGQQVALDKGAWLLDQPLRWVERQPLRLPESITPLPMVQQIINQVTNGRLLPYVNELSGEVPATIMGQPYTIATRYTYSGVPVQKAVSYMVERLQRLGLNVTTHEWDVNRPPNVIAEKPGLDPNAGIVIICGHLDSTSGSASTLAPGADDNGSGSVAVLLAAEILSHYNFDATLRFILFTGEEQGLYGSSAYADLVGSQDIRGVLNMDMIAWDSQGGPDMDVHSRSSVPGNTTLANLFIDAVSAYQLPLTPVRYDNGTTASDHAPFWGHDIPAILAIENYRSDSPTPADFNAYYHTINDRVQYFNNNYFRAMTQASLATFAHMGGLRTACYWADLNCSGLVDAQDITRAAGAWLAQNGQWSYSPLYDLDSDGHVDVVDIQRFAAQWGSNGS